jgi:predicted DNA binding protein
MWCNLETDIVEIQAPTAADQSSIARELAKREKAKVIGRTSNDVPTRLSMSCSVAKDKSVVRLIEKHGGLVTPPIVCENGWDTFRCLFFDDAGPASFFPAVKRLGDTEVVLKRKLSAPRIRDQYMVSALEFLGGLTAKQAEALSIALEEGYYRVPRVATMQEIARRRGRRRTTLEEHVRKAEGKVLEAMAPFVALGIHGDHGPGRPRSHAPRPEAK